MLLTQIPAADTRAQAEARRDKFAVRYKDRYPKAVATLERDWERMVTFYDFPQQHWRHLRTTNPVESPFASVRLRTNAGKRYKRVQSATALIWRVLTGREDVKQAKDEEGRLISFTHLLTQPRHAVNLLYLKKSLSISIERTIGEIAMTMILIPLLLLLTACDSPLGPDWEPESTLYNVVSTRISAGEFLYVRVISDDEFMGRRNFVLSGTFEVTAGGSRDISAYVVDRIGYKNFSNGNNFRALYSARRTTTDRFSISLDRADTYYFLLSNHFSILTSKTVDARLELRYKERQ